MSGVGLRRPTLAQLPGHFDLVIVGGGITGAGIAREAVRTGARVLLVEQNDFASGTSSWSSKLVHGGLRYLKNGQWRLTRESVRERQRLLGEAPGLVDPQPFLMPLYRGRKPGRRTMRLALWLYDHMASGIEASRWLTAAELARAEPLVGQAHLLGALRYLDAGTDDARLVLRLILESAGAGLTALNYVRVEQLQRAGPRTTGVCLRDSLDGAERPIAADMVINATGVWVDRLAGVPESGPRMRPLRGSHFVFPAQRLPIRHAVGWFHPEDRRPIFAVPWQGAVMCGTTDLDHGAAALDTARMSAGEAQYLLRGLAVQFPSAALSAADAIATYSGVRPVVDGGEADPSAESRESAIWTSPGLVNVTGGKLTTFRVTAREVLREAGRQSPGLVPRAATSVFAGRSSGPHQRLFGRLGASAQTLLDRMPAEAREVVHADLPYCWAELRWAAREERVVHLDDLLLRRTRIGLLLPQGGRELLPRVAAICQAELAWDEQRWAEESRRYLELWQQRHAPPV